MALHTLDAIRTKVRRLTRSVSLAQLSQADLDEYINTFVLYDFPEHLRTIVLRKQFSFTTSPYQDKYATDINSFAGAVHNPLYDFQNHYLTVHPPMYIAGYQAAYSQSREEFFGNYPFLTANQEIDTGNGMTTVFTGTIAQVTPSAGILQRNVLINSVTASGQPLALIDVPVVDPATGYNTTQGNLYVSGTEPALPPVAVDPTNTINYATGVYTVTFLVAPAVQASIRAQISLQSLGRPMSVLYYQNQFTLRPIPDQAYKVNFEVYARPSELIADTQTPELDEWWQYIAYGAAKKIFEDRMDMESVSLIMPEFKKQETLCQRRTIVQLTNERTATIYSDQTNRGSGPFWGNGLL